MLDRFNYRLVNPGTTRFLSSSPMVREMVSDGQYKSDIPADILKGRCFIQAQWTNGRVQQWGWLEIKLVVTIALILYNNKIPSLEKDTTLIVGSIQAGPSNPNFKLGSYLNLMCWPQTHTTHACKVAHDRTTLL